MVLIDEKDGEIKLLHQHISIKDNHLKEKENQIISLHEQKEKQEADLLQTTQKCEKTKLELFKQKDLIKERDTKSSKLTR